MASTATPPSAVHVRAETGATKPSAADPVSARRHFAWLIGGMAVSFLVPFIVADQLGLQRDLYYAVYVAAVVGLFVAWARDTRQPLREMFSRHWRLAVVLGVAFAAISAFIATRAETAPRTPAASSSSPPSAGAASSTAPPTGCCCRRSPSCSSSRRCATAACAAEPAGSSPGRGRDDRVAGDDRRLPRRLQRLPLRQAAQADNRRPRLEHAGARDAQPHRRADGHVGLHVGAVVHNYDTDLFLPPH
jgi:hypothetical protein